VLEVKCKDGAAEDGEGEHKKVDIGSSKKKRAQAASQSTV
jgi:hypothetical protein